MGRGVPAAHGAWGAPMGCVALGGMHSMPGHGRCFGHGSALVHSAHAVLLTQRLPDKCPFTILTKTLVA